MKCVQCNSTNTYIKPNGSPDWREHKNKTYCKICYRRIMSRLKRMYPAIYYCECGCGGTITNDKQELALFIKGHHVRGERHPKWDHSRPFNPEDYTLAVKKPI